MASILRLSNELLDRIIRAVAPSDLEALALTNKSIHTLSKKCLELHLMRKQKYSVLRFGYREGYKQSYSNTVPDDTNDPIFLLGSIIEDPNLAFYPSMIYLGQWVDDQIEHTVERRLIIDRYSKELVSIFDRSQIIPEADKDKMYDIIRHQTGKDVAICLLITILPNITAIDTQWSGYSDDTKRLARIVQSVAVANQSPVPSSHSQALTHLEQITISHWDTEGSEDIDNFGPFAMLPSLRRFYGSSIDGEGFSWPEGFRLSSSKIIEINITNSAISVEAFETLLSGISALEKFTYHHLCATVGYASYNAAGYVTALRKRASATLKLLDITAEEDDIELDEDEQDEGEQRTGSLRDFTVLESIRLQMKAFRKPENDSDHEEPLDDGEIHTAGAENQSGMEQLIEFLPPSTKTLTFCPSYEDIDVQGLFKGMAEMKTERLPNLNIIIFEWGDPLKNEMKLALEDAGISLKSDAT